ncbi:MAG: glycosyltransferase, partial [Bacteroidota bacterium]
MNPRVLISIINWNQYDYTISCIRSLQALTYDNFEILIVDNNSFNDSVSKIKKVFPQIAILPMSTNQGFAHGHQQSVEHAVENGFDLLWVLNPDLEAAPDSLSALVAAFAKYPAGIYGSV